VKSKPINFKLLEILTRCSVDPERIDKKFSKFQKLFFRSFWIALDLFGSQILPNVRTCDLFTEATHVNRIEISLQRIELNFKFLVNPLAKACLKRRIFAYVSFNF